MSSLLNSMEPEIAEGFLFLDSAKEIWDFVNEIYREREKLDRVYQLQQDINHVAKGDKAFHLYYGGLKAMWDKLQQHCPQTISIEMLKKHEEEDKVFKLLASLRSDYGNMHSFILMMHLLHLTVFVPCFKEKILEEK